MLCAIHRLKHYVYTNYPPPQMAVLPDPRPGHKGKIITSLAAGYNRKARRLIERNLWRGRNEKKQESVLSGLEIEWNKTNTVAIKAVPVKSPGRSTSQKI